MHTNCPRLLRQESPKAKSPYCLICIPCTVRFRDGFVEIEAPIIGYDVPPDADVSNIQSGANVMFSIMLDVLYNGKSEEYQSIISSIKGGEKHEV